MLTFSVNGDSRDTALRLAYMSKAVKELEKNKVYKEELLDVLGVVFDPLQNSGLESETSFGILQEDLDAFVFSGGTDINKGRVLRYVKTCVKHLEMVEKGRGHVYIDSKGDTTGDVDVLGYATYTEDDTVDVIHNELEKS